MTSADRTTPSLIEVSRLSASYGHIAALKPVDLRVEEGEFVTVLGPNGAGKTTLLRAISRLIASKGRIQFKGEDITALPTHRLAKLGIIMVQEGRGLFGDMTVLENLLLGAYDIGGDAEELERRLEQDLQSVSAAERTVRPDRGVDVRRRAADAGCRPRADGRPEAADAG